MRHSLVTSALLAALSIVLWFAILLIPALVVTAFLWGQLLHLVGDIPTPDGVPLLWPIRRRPLALPYALAVWGEPAITVTGLLLRVWLV
jgi:inner membrane protein